jgi:hypothetical protein
MYELWSIETRSRNHCCRWVYVCSLSCQECNAHAPCYIGICVQPECAVFFPHYLINGTIFEKKLLNIKCAIWFSLQLFSETLLIIIRTERDMITIVYGSSCKVPVILGRLYNSYFTLSHKRHVLREKVTEHKMCVSIFSTTFVWNITHYNKNWARYDQNCISVFM